LASFPAFVEVFNSAGEGPYVLSCDHASIEIPAEFANLGLDPELLTEHIAWDPGAREVAVELARRLDAPLVIPRVSRLVHDCNRPGGSVDAMPEESAGIAIPGNRGLSPGDRRARARRFYQPFHDALDGAIRSKLDAGLLPILVTVHSFTPVYRGRVRSVELGIVHDDDRRLADALLAVAERSAELATRRNDPYGPADGVTHTLRRHALPLGLLNVMIEIRNDLIRDEAGQALLAKRLEAYLGEALTGFAPEPGTARHA
jgi:predicted N-formylglutamate amidohydrolase